MDIMRVTARWSGFVGSPGYSNFHFAAGGGFISDAQQVADRVQSAITELATRLPSGVTVTVQPEVPVIDSDTGLTTDFQTIDPDPGVVGTSSGGYSAASGAVVNWRTNDLRAGRRIRGRTFIVPLGGTCYEDDGSLTTATLTQLRDFADTLVGGDLDSEFGVWSRPTGGSGGVFATAVGYTIPDMSAVLRSRRD